jgi:hypothetical protein
MCPVGRSLRLGALAMIAAVTAPRGGRAQTPETQTVAINAALRDSVIDGVLQALDKAYVFPEKAAEMRKAVEARRAAGGYTSVTNAVELATVLTKDLQDVSHDKHLVVRYAVGAAQQTVPAGMPNFRPTDAGACASTNPNDGPADALPGYGICVAELLAGNVGYVEIRSFAFPPEVSQPAVARAMSIVADADVLIVDIRRNGGGAPESVRLVSSYLFGEEPVLLNSLYWRPENRTDDFYTLRTIAGKRFGPDKPVYVLTSRRTFSAAEEFAYNLQARKRATIVGDTTGGGAHPGGVQRLAGSFSVFVPRGRAINPITKTNWEGTGVLPDIVVPADSALGAALTAVRTKK